ncbi:MAG: hypothetical protein L0271_22075 [Gemmatimonadetes bacterium]|nr:hypothetical protein [Gemmatimonadota bacterium]
MGREAQCTGIIDGQRSRGRLRLETDELIYRGTPRFVAPLQGLAAAARDGWLVIRHGAIEARFELFMVRRNGRSRSSTRAPGSTSWMCGRPRRLR